MSRAEPFATSRLRISKRPRLLWQPGQLRCVRRAGRRPPTPLFSPPSGPGPAAAVRGGGGVPLPWQGCASRAHSSPGWERPRDTRRGVTGVAERGGGVRTREETRKRLTKTSGVGVGSLESASPPPSPGTFRSSSCTLAGVQVPQTPVFGEGIPDYRPEGLLASSNDGLSELGVRPLPP